MKKFYLFVCALILSLNVLAEIPKNFKVYTSGVGISVPLCTKILNEYNRLYNTSAILVVKPGASSLIAIKEMANDKQFSILCFTGLAENVFNPKLYPQFKEDHDKLTSIAALSDNATLFYTRSGSPYKDLQDLIANKQDLTIGTHNAFGKSIANLIVKNSTKVVFVDYKNARDSISSLVDGTLDLYIDGGGLVTSVEAGILKSLGQFHAPKTVPWPDMSKYFPEASSLKGSTIISTSINADKADIIKFGQNLREVMKNEGIIQEIKNSLGVPNFKSVEEVNKQLDLSRALYNKVNPD